MNKFVFDKKFFEDSFSIPRMNPYWIRYCGNEKKAILHYKQNIQLAEALHQSIIDICSWINPALPAWISTVERFDKVMASAKLWYREVRI